MVNLIQTHRVVAKRASRMSTSSDNRTGRELTQAFHKNPTIENYVVLRRAHPQEIIGVGTLEVIKWVCEYEETLMKLKINSGLVLDTLLHAESCAASELSLLLMERLISRKKASKAGRTHLVSRGEAISDRLVNFLICT